MRTAADWLIRLHDAPDDESLVNAWLQWCEEDRSNLEEFQAAQSVWHTAVPAPTAVRRRASRSNAVMRLISGWRYRWTPSRALRGLVAALIVAVGISFAVLIQRVDDSASQSYATAIGGTGSTVLPDGSRVDLGPDSRITTAYTAGQRRVSVDFGEAYFSVAKDAERPFVVNAGDMKITAIGTAFNIRRHPSRVVVAVSEGEVELDSSHGRSEFGEPSDIVSTPLHAGQQAIYSDASGRIEVAAIHLADIASWRRGVLKYVHEPLGNVVLDMSRYNDKRIVISDARLRQMPFTGAIFSTRIDDALSALEGAFPLQVHEYADRIELSPRG